LGRAVEVLNQLFDRTTHKKRVAGMVKRQLKNPRSPTRKKAERFAKRWLS